MQVLFDAGALRQHRRADEMVGKELGDAEASSLQIEAQVELTAKSPM